MLRHFVVLLAVAVTAAGCAAHERTVPAAAVAGPDASLAGTWRGPIAGPDLGTAGGLVEGTATLTLAPDGHWTMVERLSGGERRSSGTSAHAIGRRLVLHGRVDQGPDKGAPVTYTLDRYGNALYGGLNTFFLGHRVDTEIGLQRQRA
jgi:hypothetical protein